MSSSANETSQNDQNLFCSSPLQVVFVVIGVLLVISLSWNIALCVSKCCSGREICRRQRQSSRQMEDNPIYGNIMCKQTEVDLPHSSISSSSVTDQQRITSNEQYKPQDCYANLTLKPPRPQSGRSSLQYSDVVQLESPPEAEKEDEGNTDTSANMSDLYASVQTQRTKMVDTTDSGEDYANHL